MLICFYSVCFFNGSHKLLEKEIFVTPFVFQVVAIAALAGVGVGHDNDHGCGLAFGDGFVGDVLHFTELNPSRLVVPATVQEIQHGVAALG